MNGPERQARRQEEREILHRGRHVVWRLFRLRHPVLSELVLLAVVVGVLFLIGDFAYSGGGSDNDCVVNPAHDTC